MRSATRDSSRVSPGVSLEASQALARDEVQVGPATTPALLLRLREAGVQPRHSRAIDRLPSGRAVPADDDPRSWNQPQGRGRHSTAACSRLLRRQRDRKPDDVNLSKAITRGGARQALAESSRGLPPRGCSWLRPAPAHRYTAEISQPFSALAARPKGASDERASDPIGSSHERTCGSGAKMCLATSRPGVGTTPTCPVTFPDGAGEAEGPQLLKVYAFRGILASARGRYYSVEPERMLPGNV
jgi:hypothetical protein